MTIGALISEFPSALLRRTRGGTTSNQSEALGPTQRKEVSECTMHPKSFISEHSAEYILVPNIVSRLNQRFTEVIPLFLWLSREGNTTAQKMMAGGQIRLLTAFPRRPKLVSGSQAGIRMKVNRELLAYTAVSEEAGMAVLVGVPLLSSLSLLRIGAECCWFELKGSAVTDRDYSVDIGLDGTVISNDAPTRALTGPLTDDAIEDLADRCRMMPWIQAVQSIREIRSIQQEVHGSSFLGGYKPFHLMLLGP